MANPIRCARCGRTITEADMENGLVAETEKGILCADCAPYALKSAPAMEPPAETPPAPPPPEQPEKEPDEATQPREEEDPIILLRTILNELRPISRAILYEKSSVWNVFGGILQVFVLALLVLAAVRWDATQVKIVLFALLLQLMTLTFFLKGR